MGYQQGREVEHPGAEQKEGGIGWSASLVGAHRDLLGRRVEVGNGGGGGWPHELVVAAAFPDGGDMFRCGQ